MSGLPEGAASRHAPRLVAFLALCAAAGLTHAADRDKTDVIRLRNGDRVTGEIDSLAYGVLKLKTSHMGTVAIEWPSIEAIESEYTFYFERVGGARYFGEVATTPDGTALIITDGDLRNSVPVEQVARISQVDSGFWRSLSGSLAFGFNFTESSDVSVTSFSFNTQHRARTIASSLSISALRTSSPEGGTSDRDQIAANVRFLRPRGNFWLTLASLERNEELGIEGRLQLGAAAGRHFVQRSDAELTGFIGLSLNQEWATGEEGGQQSLEGVLGSEWRVFKFADPETALDASLVGYPSLTESGRFRAELNTTLSREIIDDLTFDLTLYGSYDNQPPDETVSTSDYGIVTSLGYKF